MNKQETTQEQRAQLIEKLHNEYNDLNGKIARLNTFLNDIDFVKKVPDIIEQELMKGQLRAMENYLYNLRGRIMFQEAQQREKKVIDDWMSMKRTVETPCGPVRLINHDKATKDEMDAVIHHCGQDAACKVGGVGYDTRLIGYQVVGIGDMRCNGCPGEQYGEKCVKLELVGGTYLCLAPLPNSITTEQS